MYNRLAVEGLGMRLRSYHSILHLQRHLRMLDEMTKIGSNPYMWELASMSFLEIMVPTWRNRGTTETSFNQRIVLCNVLVCPPSCLCAKKQILNNDDTVSASVGLYEVNTLEGEKWLVVRVWCDIEANGEVKYNRKENWHRNALKR